MFKQDKNKKISEETTPTPKPATPDIPKPLITTTPTTPKRKLEVQKPSQVIGNKKLKQVPKETPKPTTQGNKKVSVALNRLMTGCK